MYKIIIMALILVSCSKKDQENQLQTVDQNIPEFTYEKLTVDASSEGQAVLSSSSLVIEADDSSSVIQPIEIVNQDGIRNPLAIGSLLDTFPSGIEGVSIDDRCSNRSIRSKCEIRFKYRPLKDTASTPAFSFNLLGQPLTMEFVNTTVPDTTQEIANKLSYQNSLNLGSLKQGDIVKESITLRNSSRGSILLPINNTPTITASSDVSISVASDCPAELQRYRMCRINLTYEMLTNPASDLTLAQTVDFGGDPSFNLSLSALLQNEAPLPEGYCESDDNSLYLPNESVLNDLANQDSVVLTLRNITRQNQSVCLGNLPTGLSVSGCDNPLKRFRQCDLTISKSIEAGGQTTISFNGKSVTFDAGVALNLAHNSNIELDDAIAANATFLSSVDIDISSNYEILGSPPSFSLGVQAPSNYVETLTLQPGLNTLSYTFDDIVLNIGSIYREFFVDNFKLGGSNICVAGANNKLYCWGNNSVGQIGDGSTTASEVPLAVVPGSDGFNPDDILMIESGNAYICSIDSTNSLYCFGKNSDGALGNGMTSHSSFPVAPSATNGFNPNSVSSVSAGRHTCAIDFSGKLFCWGDNHHGQTGDGITGTDNLEPKPVLSANGFDSNLVNSVVAGSSFTCAIESSGELYCWGNNSRGQLGDGTMTNNSTPVMVSGTNSFLNTDVAQVSSANGDSVCAIDSSDALFCWGENHRGQLGNNSTTNSGVPVEVLSVNGFNSKDVKMVSAGRHTCAIENSGELFCWGQNFYGELGINNAIQQNTPQKVISNDGFDADNVVWVEVGNLFTCAADNQGKLACWGLGNDGRLGSGNTADSQLPILVNLDLFTY